MRDLPDGLRDAEALVRTLDVPSPQVLIESSIVEATRGLRARPGHPVGLSRTPAAGDGQPTGVVAGGASPPRPRRPRPCRRRSVLASARAAGAALGLIFGSLDGANDLAARLTALEEAGKGKVVSRPRVVTMNNVAATIQSLTILRVKLPSTGTVINTGTGGAAETANTATEKINTGITLVVIPQVSSDGFVLLNIYAKSSVPDFSRTVEGIPTEIAREANSNVLVRDGETVVLGGISRTSGDDRETGVPFLGRVPGAGLALQAHPREQAPRGAARLPDAASSARRSLRAGAALWARARAGTPAMARRAVILAGFMGDRQDGGRAPARRDRSAGPSSTPTRSSKRRRAARCRRIFAERGRGGVPRPRAGGGRRGLHPADTVIAVGGGALLDPENRRRLLAAGPVVCLRATPRELLRRVGTARDRPLLNGDGTASEQPSAWRGSSRCSRRARRSTRWRRTRSTPTGCTPDEVAAARAGARRASRAEGLR